MHSGSSSRSTLNIFFVILLLLIGLTITWFDGISRALKIGTIDFDMLFVGAELFVSGQSPYFSVSDLTLITEHPVKNGIAVQMQLPGIFGLLSPLTALNYELVKYTWIACNFFSYLLAVIILAHIAKFKVFSLQTLTIIALCFMAGSFRMGIRHGQMDNITLLLFTVFVWMLQNKKQTYAAFFLAASMVIKPTSVGLVSLYLFAKGQRFTAILSLGIAGAFMLLCAGYIQLSDPATMNDWLTVNSSEFSHFNDVSLLNPNPGLLTHLHIALFAIYQDASTTFICAILLCLIPFIFLCMQRGSDLQNTQVLIGDLSIVLVVSLLIVYHRFYSGVFLIYPIIWAYHRLQHQGPDLPSLAILSIPFLSAFNAQAVIDELFDHFIEATGWSSLSFISPLIDYHFVWILVTALIILSWSQLYSRKQVG